MLEFERSLGGVGQMDLAWHPAFRGGSDVNAGYWAGAMAGVLVVLLVVLLLVVAAK